MLQEDHLASAYRYCWSSYVLDGSPGLNHDFCVWDRQGKHANNETAMLKRFEMDFLLLPMVAVFPLFGSSQSHANVQAFQKFFETLRCVFLQ